MDDGTLSLKITEGKLATVLHEVHHGIQHRAGFESGTNSRRFIAPLLEEEGFAQVGIRNSRQLDDKIVLLENSIVQTEPFGHFLGKANREFREFTSQGPARQVDTAMVLQHVFSDIVKKRLEDVPYDPRNPFKGLDDKKFDIFKEDINIKLDFSNVYLDKYNVVKDLNGNLQIVDNKLYQAEISAIFDNNKDFKFTINTNKNDEKITTLYSSKAKPFVKRYKFIKGFEETDEGYLDFYSIKKDRISNSKLIIDNFKVKEIPALAKLLTLASLQGIADLLTGEGVRFTDFEMNFTNKDKLMTIQELYAIGPAISILIEGYIEEDNLISLRGTLVPATTINRSIASIPLLGDLLIGKKVGEGVFGVSFKVKGPPKNLKTTVNPIKTLTPRFITRTLEKIKKN